MYEQYFGLRERPFDLSPNPRFLFLSKKHAEALAHIRYGLSGRPGVTVLTGEAGTGKTTLLRQLIFNSLEKAVVLAPTGLAAITLALIRGAPVLHYDDFTILS